MSAMQWFAFIGVGIAGAVVGAIAMAYYMGKGMFR